MRTFIIKEVINQRLLVFQGYCKCIHTYNVKLGDVVDLVIVNEAKNFVGGAMGHNMHFHGYHYYLLDMGMLPTNKVSSKGHHDNDDNTPNMT